MNWDQFFHMGGYAAYVWTSYALAFVVLLVNVVGPVLTARRNRRELSGKFRRGSRI